MQLRLSLTSWMTLCGLLAAPVFAQATSHAPPRSTAPPGISPAAAMPAAEVPAEMALLRAGLEARRAGDAAGVDAAAAALIDHARAQRWRASVVGAALLLLDRNEDAANVLLRAGMRDDAAPLLAAAMRLQELADLEPAGMQGATARARALARLGRADDAASQLRQVAESASDRARALAATTAIREAARLGLQSEATGLAISALRERTASLDPVLAALWPSREAEAVAARALLDREGRAKDAVAAVLATRDLLESASADDVSRLVEAAPDLMAGRSSCDLAALVPGLVTIARRAGDEDAARTIARSWADATEDLTALRLHAALIAEAGDWPGAVAAYDRAAARYPADAATRWLLADALERTAAKAAADSARERAMADAARAQSACTRVRLAQAMDATGAAAEARRLRESVIAAEPPTSSVAWSAAATLAARTGSAADLARSADALDALRSRLDGGQLTVERAASLARTAQLARLRAAAAGGDLDAALAMVDHALDAFVADPDATADFVAALARADREADAARAQQIVAARLADAAAASGDGSATLLNTLAWFLARTRTDLDRALEAARRATEIAPRHAGFADTLAEVLFQMGDRESAVAEARRALDLQPESAYLKRQLERFLTGDPATPPDPHQD